MENTKSLQIKRIITLYSMGFLLVFGYAFARPCIDSIFLEHYSTEDIPAAWLLITLASAGVISIYNRVNQRWAILSLYGIASLVCAGTLALFLGAYFLGFLPAIYILYIWKDLYMVVLMETYWSFADIVFSISTARNAYGLAMATASIGGVLGNLAVGPTAKAIGTENTLSFLFFFLIMGFLISYIARGVSDKTPAESKKKADIGLGVKTLLQSKYLVPLAILACTVQVVTSLIDFRFNELVKENYLNLDARTEIIGHIHAAVNGISFAVQLLMTPILRVFSIGNGFLSVPLLLAISIVAFIIVPSFAVMVVTKITNKTLDYSLFRGTKEILYIPLSREEKTQGKGIIDIFMYRFAKGLSSLILIALISFGFVSYIMELSLALVLFWLVLAAIIVKRYHGVVKSSQDT